MKSQKRNIKENYIYGFFTGVGASILAATFYVRWILSMIYPNRLAFDYNWYSSIMGMTFWLLILAFVVAFGGLMLGLSTIKESTLEADSLIEESDSGQRT